MNIESEIDDFYLPGHATVDGSALAEGVNSFLRRWFGSSDMEVLGLGLGLLLLLLLLFGGETAEETSGYGFELRLIHVIMFSFCMRMS